jgi:D-beta-D-heptose 7-phosphate kinase/D-beta-D-heptose 1-phosphate adenosyltransferase
VAIVNVSREEHKPGGAGNVILNLLSLGASVVAIGRVGDDWAGDRMKELLQSEGVSVEMIMKQKHYLTPVKNRIIADNQQIVRIDREQIISLDDEIEEAIISALPAALEGVQVVAISDYGKGLLTKRLLTVLIHEAKRRHIPVITDPKGQDFTIYSGTTVIKPNLSEAYAAANLPMTASLDLVAPRVLEQADAKLLMITRSEAGISLFDDDGKRLDFPVHAKEVKDVTGAGDTVLAVLTHAIANQLTYPEAAQLCNVAAGIAIEHVGCARVTLSDLAHRLFLRDMSNKVFDEDHFFVLQEILRIKPYQLLVVSQVEQLTTSLFQAIKQLSVDNIDLVVYVSDMEPGGLLIEMLASLQEVSFVLTHLDSVKALALSTPPVNGFFYDNALRTVHTDNLGSCFPSPLCTS